MECTSPGITRSQGREAFEEGASGETVKHEARVTAADFVGDQHLRTSRTLGVGEFAVFSLDEKTPERNHEQDAQQATTHRQ